MTHSCELENFSSQVLEDSGNVDGSLGSNAHFVLGVVLQETLDTTAGELEERHVSIAEPARAHKIVFVDVEVVDFGISGGWG